MSHFSRNEMRKVRAFVCVRARVDRQVREVITYSTYGSCVEMVSHIQLLRAKRRSKFPPLLRSNITLALSQFTLALLIKYC